MEESKAQGLKDASRIDLTDEYEVKHWTERFRITREELEKVVKKVGFMVDDVRKELEPIKGTA